MAYDPQTGQWKDEETSVEKNLTGLLSKDSDYLEQGRAAGQMDAQRRGLLNSSIATQAGEAARIDRALPIASQDASQANQREMQGRGLQSAEKLQGTDIASRERMQGTDIAAQKDLQGSDIASREKMQGTDIAARERLQATDVESQKWLAQFDAGTRERLQGLDSATRLTMQSLDIESQQRIANLNIASSERSDASKIAASLELGYASMLATIMNNPDIPADTRQTYIDHANKMRDSNLALIEQFFGIDLQWDTGGP